jgi:hypothetical protein
MPFAELIQHARACRHYRAAILELSGRLPPDDADLNVLLEAVVKDRDELAFRSLALASLVAGRCFQARHLAAGAALFDDPCLLGRVAFLCEGNVGEALVEAVHERQLLGERAAAALLLAAQWCLDPPEQALPERLVPLARTLARHSGDDFMKQTALMILANLTHDEDLRSILQDKMFESNPAFEEAMRHLLLEETRRPLLESLPEKAPPAVISGYTVRRAVPRLGRNDPCHCGSGKKYKKCCYDKDQDRLMQSSSVAGLTKEELREQPEAGLDTARLRTMRSYELFRLEFEKVPPELQWDFLERLLFFREYERAVSALEFWGYETRFDFIWNDLVYRVTERHRIDWLERLIALRTDKDFDQDRDLAIGPRLLLAHRDGRPLLDMIEAHAVRNLEPSGASDLAELAYGLMEGPAPALGILIARGLIATGNVFDSEMLGEAVFETRDKLRLSSHDPVENILNDRFMFDDFVAPEESGELSEARRNLETRTDELRRMRIELDTLRRDLEAQEKRVESQDVEPDFPAPTEAPPDQGPSLDELRLRVRSMKDMLKERHAERNQLRRDLQAARREIETLHERNHETTAADSASQAEEREESLLSGEVAADHQPVRVPEYSKKFHEALAALPAPVARASLALIGRLAGGDRSAFRGVKQLKALPAVLRQRVGGDHRLLFRLRPDQIEILDLINRRDLEKCIKTLS